MKRIHLGPALVFLGVFGGGLFWIVLTGLRFDSLVAEFHNGVPGEAIWSLDPLFTIFAAIPGMILIFFGFLCSVLSTSEYSEEGKPEMDYRQLNLFYLGEICLLVTAIVSFIGFLGVSSLIAEVVRVSAIAMGVIAVTCLVHMLSFVLREVVSKAGSSNLTRNTAILLAVELLTLLSAVLVFRLYNWSFIRSTTLIIESSGFIGLLLLTPRFLNLESKNGGKGEI
ncbi:MAG: hypothetical protein P1Q69_05850 [Candidatus Thorarchaeota archaeon]|nr:hypothetical protein [Candidatus Thorarchaeota archaeon]